tara:strand:+ start:215 stop:568 length:354 start_codon:yes stop_codon:yes gene_type:complete
MSTSQILHKIFSKLGKWILQPILILASSFTLLVGSLISYIDALSATPRLGVNGIYVSMGLLIFAISIFIISIIYSIIFKFWGRLVLYITIHFIFLAIYFWFIVTTLSIFLASPATGQ